MTPTLVKGRGFQQPGYGVMFQLNILLDLSTVAMTLTFGSLLAQLLFEVLCKNTGFVGVWVIQGCKCMGDIPGVQGGSGGSVGSATSYWIDTRTQT